MLYLPFGESMADQKVDQFDTPYKYTGKEIDNETGLYYYGARYYDPSVSQFMGVDPLADSPANISFSPYTYVWNNPTNAIDPDGRHGEWIKEEDENGNVVYTAQEGDSAKSLEEQHGVSFDVGNAIIQMLFGENLPNGTPEGRSNIHPGDKIALYVANMEPSQSEESRGGLMGWFRDLFDDNSSNTGGFAIFAKGSRSGWDLEGRPVGSKGKITPINISDMLTPGGGNSNKFLSSKVRSQFLIWEYNFINSGVKALKAFDVMPYGRTDSTFCEHCQKNVPVKDTSFHPTHRDTTIDGRKIR